MTAPFRYRRLSYVALDVSDLEQSLGFYRDLVGLTVDRRDGDTAYLRCSELPQTLVLREGDTPGLARAAFELESQADPDRAFPSQHGRAPRREKGVQEGESSGG